MKYPQPVSVRTVSGIWGWLSGELDAHGLDGPVYARLLLSLLHAPARLHATDLVDEVAGSESKQSRKRVGPVEDRSWLETHCDLWSAEQVKRYAAVECLKSASEEKSGIESLVDELCVKLREIENEPSSDKEHVADSPSSSVALTNSPNDNDSHYDNPAQLADKYYAAFPALSELNTEETSIALYPNTKSVWLTNSVKTTPFKKATHRSGKKSLRQKSDTASKMWKETSDMEKKQHGRNRQEIGKKSKNRARNRMCPTEQWDTVWEFGKEELLREYINNQCNNKDEGYDTPIKCNEKDLDEVCFNREWIIEYELNANAERPETVVDEINMAKFAAKFNESVEALWNDDKQNESIDELNLPVDFQDLLSSPSDRMFDENMDMKKSILPTGRTLKNSIWSENLNEDDGDCMLNEKSFYPRVGGASDEYKHQLEMVRSCWETSDMEVKDIKNQKEFSSMPWQSNFSSNDLVQTSTKWSDVISQSFVNTPYRMLNHSEHSSGFSAVVPSKGTKSDWPDTFGVTPKPFVIMNYNNFASKDVVDKVDDDLLTSSKTHFRPIKDDGYADGTTFAISSTIDHVNYKLCEDGLLAISSDTQSRRYMIYKQADVDGVEGGRDKDEFIIKFCVKQISKSCQTDEFMFDILRMPGAVGGLMSSSLSTRGDVCCCGTGSKRSCMIHTKTAASLEMETFDKELQQLGATRKWCTKQHDDSPLNNNNNIWTGGSDWLAGECSENPGIVGASDSSDPLLRIWSSNKPPCCDICRCVDHNVSDIHELKSEIHKDGEEILSDLSYMQSLYIGSEWEDDASTSEKLVNNETPFDVSKLISNFIKPDEMLSLLNTIKADAGGATGKSDKASDVDGLKSDRKRRHSSTQRQHKEASGECKKPHCKFSHEITSMPCQFWADNSCQPDGLCPYQHPSAYTRPLTR